MGRTDRFKSIYCQPVLPLYLVWRLPTAIIQKIEPKQIKPEGRRITSFGSGERVEASDQQYPILGFFNPNPLILKPYTYNSYLSNLLLKTARTQQTT